MAEIISCDIKSARAGIASFQCTFDSSNRISCNGGPATDLTSFLDGLPETDYIVFSFTTNGSVSPPNEASVQVQFR